MKGKGSSIQKRIKYGKEPSIKHYGYLIVTIFPPKRNGQKCRFTSQYAYNLPQVDGIRKKAPKGSVVEVYKLSTNFREAWQA